MSTYDPLAGEAILASPLPTPTTLKHRRNVIYQLVRFIAINLKMVRVIAGSHKGGH